MLSGEEISDKERFHAIGFLAGVAAVLDFPWKAERDLERIAKQAFEKLQDEQVAEGEESPYL